MQINNFDLKILSGSEVVCGIIRGAFNNEPVNDRDPLFQENFKTTSIVVCH